MAKQSQQIIVIGGGLIGISMLYELSRRGIEAVLLEAGDQLAHGASFANGGMMTPSQCEPWNGPGVFGHLLASLFNPYSAMKLHLRTLPGLTGWGLQFLQNSVPRRYLQSAENNFFLAAHSAQITAQIIEKHTICFDQSSGGSMKVFANRSAWEKSRAMAEHLAQFGMRYQLTSPEQMVQIEPQLAHAANWVYRAIYYPDDWVGNAYLFARELAQLASKAGAKVRTNTPVLKLLTQGNQVIGVQTNKREFLGPVVVCAGTGSAALLARLGLNLPIQPVKGYSLTMDAGKCSKNLPRISVIDEAMHTAISPLAERLRVVGTAEFAGFDRAMPPRRLQNLRRVFARVYPHLHAQLDGQQAQPWAGLRPMSSDGMPIIGAGVLDGLWLNCGHGHLGWTMAAGSADLLVSMIQGQTPAIDPLAFRFGRR